MFIRFITFIAQKKNKPDMLEKFQPAKQTIEARFFSKYVLWCCFSIRFGNWANNRSREFVDCINESLPGKLLEEVGNVFQAGAPVLLG